MKGCLPDTEEEKEELNNRANQCVLYRKGDKLGDSLINEYCIEKYDSQGCNICSLQPDNQWLCTMNGCLPDTEEEIEKLKWLSNLCVGYAEYPIDNSPGDGGVIGVPSEPAPPAHD